MMRKVGAETWTCYANITWLIDSEEFIQTFFPPLPP